MKVKWYRPLLYYLVVFLHKFVLLLPRRVVLALFEFFGNAAFYILRKEVNKALSNLKYVYPGKSDRERKTIARSLFKSLALTAADFSLFPRYGKNDILKIVDTSDTFMIDKAKGENGLIIITAHIGNWELLAAAIGALGYEGIVIGRKLRYYRYDKLVTEIRKKQGIVTYYRDKPAMGLVRELRKGRLVGILPDQDISSLEGIFMDFLGREAYTVTGPAKLAVSAKVNILTAFMIRLPDNNYKLYCDKIIPPEICGESKEKASVRITREWSKSVEKFINRYPEQWVWIHNRWKTKRR